MKLTKQTLMYLICTGFFVFVSTAQAGEGHAQDNKKESHHAGMSSQMSHQMGDMFLEKKEIDGYAVSFHVMQAKTGMEHGGNHNIMVKVEQKGRVLADVVINSKVIHPDGNAESKPLRRMGDWYMAGYDLGHSGKHQLMILFKTADGKKHKGGVFYTK